MNHNEAPLSQGDLLSKHPGLADALRQSFLGIHR